ncbi:outer membrane lipoprotein carrier protein [Moraxella cuniculi DSM 21768]|uniref:Outer-membrane lipoprotein carrier protein n=1 Tax=Moraxella cuniculi DSM 21768 TaxID=1122245 RepID=A0A1N7F2X7_9GAMM|nr:outer membrane lipoprotein chaperone LolA [Moraxella cuniculi]SIR94565.1 outer membrane lipoprotein carrier protein [Moraxella cuniculi DSM 21768]
MTNFAPLKAMSLKAMLAIASLSMAAVPMALPINAQAAAASEQTATKNLNQLLIGIKSMTANFSQTTQAGNKKSQFTGVMSAQRQNQFRWQIKSPAEQLIVANGNTLWVYDKDLQQATRQAVGNQVGETPALLLSGDPAQIGRNFSVSQPNTARNYFVLTPKSSNASFKSLSLSFNGGRPVMMVLHDNIGQITSIRFSNISLNKKIPATEFNFTPPSGTDVISQ